MFDEYKTTTPYPTDYLSQIFSNIRQIKNLFEERYTLDHHLNGSDKSLSDGHNKLTMKAITVDMYIDKSPYPINPATGIAQLPDNGAILFCKLVNGSHKLAYSVKDNTGTVKEIILR